MSTEVLAGRYRLLADREFAGYSALYERLARAMADDQEALELVVDLCHPNQLPVRLFACVHEIVLTQPESELAAIYREPDSIDPWPAFRRLLFDRIDELSHLMRTRSIQTNEVGRTSALVPAFADVQARFGGRPLSIIELGSSAGLNLVADRYRIDYSDGRTTGPLDAALTLRCDVVGSGSPPLPEEGHPLDIVRRIGIDLAPIDVTDPVACRWLEACLWPDMTDRASRLRTAIEIARRDPPVVRQGNALDLLVPTIATVPTNSVVVVVSTWVLAYFSKPDRLEVVRQLAEAAKERDVALITAEYPKVTPWIPTPDRNPATHEGEGATLLGLTLWQDGIETDVALAWMQAHGLWIDWLDQPS